MTSNLGFQFYLNTVIIGPFCILGILGNTISFFILFKEPQNRVAIFLLQVLAIADNAVLIISFITMSICQGILMTVDSHSYLLIRPYLIKYVNPAGGTAQCFVIYTTLLLAVNRYAAICRPFAAARFLNMTSVRIQVILVLLVSLILNLPLFLRCDIGMAAVSKKSYLSLSNTTEKNLIKNSYLSLNNTTERNLIKNSYLSLNNTTEKNLITKTVDDSDLLSNSQLSKFPTKSNCSENATTCLYDLSNDGIWNPVGWNDSSWNKSRWNGVDWNDGFHNWSVVGRSSSSDQVDSYETCVKNKLGNDVQFNAYFFNGFYNIVVFALPLVFLILFNISIACQLQAAKYKMRANSLSYEGRQEDNISFVMIFIIVQLIVFHLPDRFCLIAKHILPPENIMPPHALHYALFISNLLIIFNCTNDFIIYFAFRKRFRAILLASLCHSRSALGDLEENHWAARPLRSNGLSPRPSSDIKRSPLKFIQSRQVSSIV